MIDKFLRRFCAQEVQILIKKLEEDYSAFNGYENQVWRKLLEAKRCRTDLENYCVRKAERRADKSYDRQQYLAAILQQQLNPKTQEEFEDSVPMSQAKMKALYSQQMAQQQAYNQLRNQIAGAAQQMGVYR